MSKKKAKNKKINRNKILLDTSVQINKIIYDSTRGVIDSLSASSDIYTSFFVLYEFKSGLIKTLIDFYLRAKLSASIPEAISSWSNSFKIREVKNKVHLEALMLKLFGSIDGTSKDRYLAQVESVIFHLLLQFEVELKSIVGSFGGDSIVKYKIRSNEDYEEFLALYNGRKVIPQVKFWQQHLSELEQILIHTGTKTAAIKKINKNLELIKTDLTNADKHNTNKGIGDAVIAVDSPKQFTIASFDTSFEYLCDALGKKFLKVTV